MSLTIVKNLHNIAASEEKHLLEIKSSIYTNLGFKYKVEYYKAGTNDILHTQRMAPNPDLSGGVRFNVHTILQNYVNINKDLSINGNWYSVDEQQYKYDIKVIEEYIEEKTINDHFYIMPYASQGKTVFQTTSAHGYSEGDVININITNVTYTSDPTQVPEKLEIMQNAYNGVHTVTDIISSTQFTIQVPFATSTSSTSGKIHYNDMRLKEGGTSTISDRQIVYNKPSYEDIYNSVYDTYTNKYDNVTRYVGINNRQIYDWQDMFIMLLENKNNNVSRVLFTTDNGKQGFYLCSNSNAITKMINVNPNKCTLQMYADPEPFLDGAKYYTIGLYNPNNVLQQEYRYTLIQECPIYKDEILFIDDMGALQSFGVTLNKTENTSLSSDNHVRKDTYFDFDSVMNTNNNSETILTARMDWLSYSEYKYSEQLFKSKYAWLKEENKALRPVIIEDKNFESLSSHNTRYSRTINVRLV